MKKLISIFLVIGVVHSSNFIYASEGATGEGRGWGIPTSALPMREYRPEYITLLSKDGKSYEVLKSIAISQSSAIAAFLESNPDTTEFPTDIPGILLDYFAATIQSLYINQYTYVHSGIPQGKALFDAVLNDLEQKIAPSIPADAAEQLLKALHIRYLKDEAGSLQQKFPLGLCIALFNAAAKYGFTFLFQLMGRQIMKFAIAEPYLFDYIKSKMVYGEFWQEELARWHYLLTGKKMLK